MCLLAHKIQNNSEYQTVTRVLKLQMENTIALTRKPFNTDRCTSFEIAKGELYCTNKASRSMYFCSL